MKRLVIISLLVITCLSAGAADYYVKNGGNDSADGLSDATAWATLAKVQASTFSGGDNIHLNRGDIFRGYLHFPSSGSAGNHITIDAYGTGAKPLILNSKELSLTGDWTNHSGNIWKTTATAGAYNSTVGYYDIGNLFMNDNTSWGRKELALVDCDTQGDFYFNPSDQLIYIYSTTNPASYYTNIECGGNYAQYSVWFTGRSYITVRNIAAMYAGNNCIYLDGGSNNMIIEHCDVSWVGGWWYAPPVRMGNGIGMWLNGGNQHDITIQYNYVDQCWDAGISPQGTIHTTSNILMSYNLITNCHYSYETWCTSPNQSLINADFVNNTCINAGYSWSYDHREDSGDANDSHVMIWTTSGTVTDCDIKNNIFYGSRTRGLIIRFTGTLKFLMDANLYYDNPVIGENDDLSIVWEDLAEWQTASGRETNSLNADPLFISSTDYRLNPLSPAIDAGENLGLTTDYAGNIVPAGNSPDIGIFEYMSDPAPPPVTGSVLGTGSGNDLMVDENGRIIIIQY